MRWGTPLAAWRDPAETQAAEPTQNAAENVSTMVDTPTDEQSETHRPHPGDRFDHAPKPVRILMKDGVWLVPESERPLDKEKPR
jgi:hypothetical protein